MQLDRIEGKPDETVAWGSDVAAQMLRRLGVPYISLNPGASYRGLHDSLVNHLGNERPGILLCTATPRPRASPWLAYCTAMSGSCTA